MSDGYTSRCFETKVSGTWDHLDGCLPVLLHLQGLRRKQEDGDGDDVPVDHVLGVVSLILVGVSDGYR